MKGLALTVLILAVCAPVAAAAPADQRLLLSLRVTHGGRDLMDQLLYNCDLFFSNGFVPESPDATTVGVPTGSVDLAAGHGSAFVRRSAWQVEALPPTRAKPVRFADLGVLARGRKVFVTARVTSGRKFISAARRERLAVMRNVRLDSGPLRDRRSRSVPNTFSTAVFGKLKLLPAMARALERARCKDTRRNRFSKRLKPGYTLGRFVAELRPDHARGLAGEATLEPDIIDDDTGDTLAQGRSTAPITAGLPIPLACSRGIECAPSGGAYALGGGFDLVHGDRRVAVRDLSVVTDGDRTTVNGTLDGAPVVVAAATFSPYGLTEDFAARAGAALGATPDGSLTITPSFTKTGS